MPTLTYSLLATTVHLHMEAAKPKGQSLILILNIERKEKIYYINKYCFNQVTGICCSSTFNSLVKFNYSVTKWLSHLETHRLLYLLPPDLWLQYIQEELGPGGQPENCGKIHWRAMKFLEGESVERFTSKYTLLQTGHLWVFPCSVLSCRLGIFLFIFHVSCYQFIKKRNVTRSTV